MRFLVSRPLIFIIPPPPLLVSSRTVSHGVFLSSLPLLPLILSKNRLNQLDANAGIIAANGGLEAVAAAMTNHADHRAVQENASWAVLNVFWSNAPPSRIARAKAAGLVPLLQRAAGTDIPNAATALEKLGV